MNEDSKQIRKKLIDISQNLIKLIEQHKKEFGGFFDEHSNPTDNEFLDNMKKALIIFKSLEIKND